MNHMYTSNDDILTRQTKYYEFDITKKKNHFFFNKKNGYYIKKSFFFHYEFYINQIFIYFPSNTPNGNANDFLYASYRESSL